MVTPQRQQVVSKIKAGSTKGLPIRGRLLTVRQISLSKDETRAVPNILLQDKRDARSRGRTGRHLEAIMRKLQGTQPARRPCYLGTSQSQALEKTSRRMASGRTSTAAKFITEALALRVGGYHLEGMAEVAV